LGVLIVAGLLAALLEGLNRSTESWTTGPTSLWPFGYLVISAGVVWGTLGYLTLALTFGARLFPASEVPLPEPYTKKTNRISQVFFVVCLAAATGLFLMRSAYDLPFHWVAIGGGIGFAVVLLFTVFMSRSMARKRRQILRNGTENR